MSAIAFIVKPVKPSVFFISDVVLPVEVLSAMCILPWRFLFGYFVW